jgi:hypothetical protein
MAAISRIIRFSLLAKKIAPNSTFSYNPLREASKSLKIPQFMIQRLRPLRG